MDKKHVENIYNLPASAILLVLVVYIVYCVRLTDEMSIKQKGCKPPHFEEASYPGDLIPQWTDINGILRYRCNDAYKDIETYTKCTGNDQWESLFPPCELVYCEIPEKPPHSNHTVVSQPGVGDTISYSCEEGRGYTGTSTRVCERSGKWSGVPGKCEEIKCPDLTQYEDRQLTLLPPYRYNDKVSIKCEEDYSSNEITCQGDSSWSGTLGHCIEENSVNCSRPHHDTQMIFVPDHEVYPYNSTVNVSCKTGYYYNGSTHYWNCTIQSRWSGNGLCQAVYCDRPTFKIENGHYTECTSCPYGTRLEINCTNGYRATDSPRCGQDGQWINTNTTCEQTETRSFTSPITGLAVGLALSLMANIIFALIGMLYQTKSRHESLRGQSSPSTVGGVESSQLVARTDS